MRKVGIMGGTFDPIHIGHLILGETAYAQFGLDEVLFMPSGNPPHKKNREGRASDEERLLMVQYAVRGNDHFRCSDIEMHPDGYSYTYKTLEMLKEENPDTEYYFIIGADSLFDFTGWMKPERICAACVLVVATRNHTSDEALDAEIARVSRLYHADIRKLDSENIDISSAQIRAWVANGRTIRYYVPDAVISLIEQKGLYTGQVVDV